MGEGAANFGVRQPRSHLAVPAAALTRVASSKVIAVEHVRRMRGGTQAHLLRCSDGYYYVVKFPNNPQGTRALACDLLGTLLAIHLRLPAQRPQVVEVSEDLILNSDELVIQSPSGATPCLAGKCFGSRYPFVKLRPIPMLKTVIDCADYESAAIANNLQDIPGILVFDHWAGNTDPRQMLMWRDLCEGKWHLSMIDQGRCFNGTHWNFPNSPLSGFHHSLGRYFQKRDLTPFEPWLHRLEHGTDLNVLKKLSRSIPAEWYENDQNALDALLNQLDNRRAVVRRLIETAMHAMPTDQLAGA